MPHPLALLFAILEATARPFGLDIHTQQDTSGMGWLAFAHTDHGKGNHEVWGLGLHVVVSPLNASRRASRG